MPGVIVNDQSAKAPKPTKNAQRRAKKKLQKHEPSSTPAADTVTSIHIDANNPPVAAAPAPEDPIQDVPTIEPDVDEIGDVAVETVEDPLFSQFANVFAKFQEEDKDDPALKEPDKPAVFYDDDDNIQSEDEEAETKQRLSKKARKAAAKLSIAELKAIVRKPEIVDWTDTSAQDPKLLVNIKSARNVVPVPTHWSLKREYLSSKRGVEKAGFALPKFIAETGISEMRDAVLEKQADASLKQQQRARVQVKMGKLDIDYQKLYEAFFRRQTKPTLTRYGEVYYEGKEYETNLRHLRPGEVSDELAEALNMPPGAPPPWLINMQKIGPPPSYPALKIPGLNAPPPLGAQWGFHPGGYGKPPTNDDGVPLWGGDIFGLADGGAHAKDEAQARAEAVDKSLWGELQPYEPEEEEEEEEEEDEGDEDEDKDVDMGAGMETPFGGTETPGGITSTVPTDFGGTHSMSEEFNLRKQRRGTETEETNHPRSAGQVLHERSTKVEGFFGSDRAYDLSNARSNSNNMPTLEQQQQRGNKRKAGDLDVSMDPDALEREDRLSKDEIKRQYEAQRAQQASGGWQGGSGVVDQEDLSAMIAEESAKRLKRDNARREGDDGGKGGKKGRR